MQLQFLRTYFIGLFLFFFIGSCAHPGLLQNNSSGLEPSEDQKKSWQSELRVAWENLEKNQNELAYKQFTGFNKNHPMTIYQVEARLGEAQSLEQLGEYTLAHKIYREITTERLTTHPALAALAFFASSRTSEALGQEAETRAALQDAEARQDLLPIEIRVAALPARIALSELKVGDTALAKKYLEKAQLGIKVLKQNGVDPTTWAKLYFEMGSFSTHQINPENFKQNLEGFHQGQIFLLESIESGALPWADRSLDVLKKHYQNIWNFAMNPEVSRALDREAQERTKVELRQNYLSQISFLVNRLRLHFTPEESSPSQQKHELNQFLQDLENELQKQMNSDQTILPLTRESQSRRRIQKLKNIESQDLPFKKESPASSKLQDPNLKPEEKAGRDEHHD